MRSGTAKTLGFIFVIVLLLALARVSRAQEVDGTQPPVYDWSWIIDSIYSDGNPDNDPCIVGGNPRLDLYANQNVVRYQDVRGVVHSLKIAWDENGVMYVAGDVFFASERFYCLTAGKE